ncbi:MAG: DUF5668 domain-containing protein [Candidatus Aminicenantes bacterium]|nr:DUF5668 domain-containing protein [Candidatus Aminicenantes bacterium]
MANSKRKDSLVWGFILIVVGALFLLDSLDVRFDAWHYLANLWPIILIAWGAWKLYLGIKEAGAEDTPAKSKK